MVLWAAHSHLTFNAHRTGPGHSSVEPELARQDFIKVSLWSVVDISLPPSVTCLLSLWCQASDGRTIRLLCSVMPSEPHFCATIPTLCARARRAESRCAFFELSPLGTLLPASSTQESSDCNVTHVIFPVYAGTLRRWASLRQHFAVQEGAA